MHRILFICYGNICRSPMAEFVMKDLVHKRGQEKDFFIASCGTSTEELGNPVYPPAQDELQKHGISCVDKVSVRLQPQDYQQYDLLIAMDSMNVRTIVCMMDGDPVGKVHKMMEHTPCGGDVADPWYTRRFDIAYRDILQGCEGWLEQIMAK